MSDTQGLANFPGVQQLRGASFTLAPGVTPSVAVLEIVPQPRLETLVGTLVLRQGTTELRFPDCRIDAATMVRNSAGLVVRVAILDRRWRWRNGAISGHYNVWRSPESLQAARLEPIRIDHRDLVVGTERTPQELCALCLDALGESDYDLSQVPNLARPTVRWDYANPAQSLAVLARELGCRVVLRTDNTVAVVPIGVGRELPRDLTLSEESISLDPPEPARSRIVVCGAHRYQADLPLEAVGQDIDGTIRPIDELSYKPSHDWHYVDLEYMNEIVDLQARDLARETVFRWYRVADDFLQSLPVDWEPFQLRRNDILPLHSEQLETSLYAGVESPKPAQLFGQWYEPGQNIVLSNSVESLMPVTTEGDAYSMSALYRKSFQIDGDRGIVRFREPVYRLAHDSNGAMIQPAQLRLRTSFAIRDPVTGMLRRLEHDRGRSGASRAEARFVSLADCIPQAIAEYDANYRPQGMRNNWLQVRAAADAYLEHLDRHPSAARPETLAYVGLRAINPDGAIQQVTWNVGLAGTSTRAARFATSDWFAPLDAEQVLFTSR